MRRLKQLTTVCGGIKLKEKLLNKKVMAEEEKDAGVSETPQEKDMSDALKKMAKQVDASPKPEAGSPVDSGEDEAGPKQESEAVKTYLERATVNGIEMRVDYAFDNMQYEIYFPQIKEAIVMSENSETARKVFGFAKEFAKTAKDVSEVYSAVQDKAAEEIDREESEEK